MKRYWIITNGDSLATDGYVPLTFTSERDAEAKARELAEESPGKRFVVFEAVSSFSVSAMVEERAR